MDTELAERLSELKEGVARIDERTVAIHDSQENLSKTLERHEAEDRVDFKDVRSEIAAVRTKQNWMLGVGTAVVAVSVAVFKGMFGG